MNLKIFIMIVFFAACNLHSFSIKDIPDSSFSLHQTEFVSFVKDSIEPFSQRWVKNWHYPVSKDLVIRRIRKSLSFIDDSRTLQKEYTSALVKSLLWHYLYQLEVDSAFKKM